MANSRTKLRKPDEGKGVLRRTRIASVSEYEFLAQLMEGMLQPPLTEIRQAMRAEPWLTKTNTQLTAQFHSSVIDLTQPDVAWAGGSKRTKFSVSGSDLVDAYIMVRLRGRTSY